ncbi:hypothetical protein [Actinosynnema sp. NPDC020468]|uniref:hypothetical protein n=1 Tax=Actinosynnema sp. NPDC020468 TaxID=3154488 RepID=UPI0033D282E0
MGRRAGVVALAAVGALLFGGTAEAGALGQWLVAGTYDSEADCVAAKIDNRGVPVLPTGHSCYRYGTSGGYYYKFYQR